MTTDQWDIRLQCTICGVRTHRHRADGNPPFGREPVATVTDTCYNCTAEAGHPDGDVQTLHFVDFATDAELESDRPT